MLNKIRKLNYKYSEKTRFNNTIKFLKKTLPINSKILDLYNKIVFNEKKVLM